MAVLSRKNAGIIVNSFYSLYLVSLFFEFTLSEFQPPTTKLATTDNETLSIQRQTSEHTIQPYSTNISNPLTKRALQPFRSNNQKPPKLKPLKQLDKPAKLKPQPSLLPKKKLAKLQPLPNQPSTLSILKSHPILRNDKPDASIFKDGGIPPKLYNEYTYNLQQNLNSTTNQDGVGGEYITDTILENAPWSIKLLLLNGQDEDKSARKYLEDADEPYRQVGIEALTARRQVGTPSLPALHLPDDDNNMRLKLFRLMYETVRDSDLKVKRAELICKHYKNSTAFEVGFLMGEVQEKFDVINEFAGTLKKYYMKWRPIEHINAYEQIANNAIQITHLIDLIKTISKENTTNFK